MAASEILTCPIEANYTPPAAYGGALEPLYLATEAAWRSCKPNGFLDGLPVVSLMADAI
jgi:hypothetical protein